MCCYKCLKSFLPFVLAFLIGTATVSFSQEGRRENIPSEKIEIHNQPSSVVANKGGTGFAACSGKGRDYFSRKYDEAKLEKASTKFEITGFRILSKPEPEYTEEARRNSIEGVVRLRVVFKADNSIGLIEPTNSLPYGLTEKAVESAKKIKFETANLNGKPRSVSKIVEYRFAIY